jgi:hypothetical protein
MDEANPGLVHLTDLRRQTFTTVDADLASQLPHWPELQAV